MVFKIEITAKAILDIEQTVDYIAIDASPAIAAIWKEKLQAIICSLQELPARFPVIQEATEAKFPYRIAYHYSHGVIFRIDEEKRLVYNCAHLP